MTLAEMTALMSRVGKKQPDLVADRNVVLFIQACIEEARAVPGIHQPLPAAGDASNSSQ